MIIRTLLGLLLLTAAAGAIARPLALTDYLDWESVSDPRVSPDGSQVVYTRQRVDKIKDRMASDLWIMNSDGSRNRFLLESAANARWSPDGERMLFIKEDGDEKPQIFVRWMDAEGAVTQITRHLIKPSQPAWSPDGTQIAFKSEVALEPSLKITLPPRPDGAEWTEDPTVIDRMHYRGDRVGMRTGFKHLFVVNSEGGTARQITSGTWDVGQHFNGIDRGDELRWTPDGKQIVFSGMADEALSDHGRRSDINLVELASGEVRKLSSNPGTWGVPSISPDGRLVAYAGGTDTPDNFPPVELRVVGIDGQADRSLLRNMPASISNSLWDQSGRGLFLTLQKEGSDNVHYVNLDGQVRDVTDGAQRIRLASRSRDSLYGVVSSAHGTGNVTRINARNGALTQQTDVNADVLAAVELGEVEEIWYDSTDETRIQGWIVKPPGFDPKKTYPLVLQIHGGPNAMYGVNFSFRFQEFAARGYVVLYTNPRGSTGYDYDFVNAINFKYPGRADFDDLMAGVDAILDRGYIDEDRLYAAGCSGGGVLTAWLVTHTDRFAAAASLCPVINWISQAGNADITRWSMERFDVPFWEDPTKWLEHSPLMHVARVTTPTLLMTGIQDLRTPLGQAEEFYAALKYLGVPTVLIPMHEEFHGTTSKPSNLLRTQLYLQAWFDRYGGGASGMADRSD